MSSGNHGTHRPPERLADRYDVQEPIGEGATAITYRGWDDRLEREVAIKILRRDLARDESFVRRFRQEARAAASVSHGNVVNVYDFGQQDEALFIVMQYVNGGDLKKLIQREAPLDPARVRAITGQVLDGLQAIHSAGIVHRDIKPQNVLIGRDGRARVTDFGVAHLHEDSGMTTAGTTVGTAAYMAPEQAQAGRVTEATDLYAVGVMLYEMLTGYLPFNAPTAMATMLEHIQREPVPPSQRLPGRGITPAMDSVVLQALAKDPGRRFNTARAMKQAVGQVFLGDGGGRGAIHTTVATPAVQSTMQQPRTWPSERRASPPPYIQEPVSASMYEGRRASRDEGAGVNGAVRGLLTVIVLGVFAVFAWFLFDNLQNENSGGGGSPTATTEVTATLEPTDEPGGGLIEPVEPTATSEPTQTPEPTPEPTATNVPPPTQLPTPMPTAIPTEIPTEAATEEAPIIEPIDITPIPTDPPQG